MNCGAVKESTSGAPRLVCNLPAGHEGPLHGVTQGEGMPPYIHWGPGLHWTDEDERWLEERHSWRKGHVRREYQTLKTWKMKQGA